MFLYFPALNLNDLTIRCYTDASYGNLSDGGSQGGYYLELVSEHNSAPLDWQSKRLFRTPHSSLAAETISMVEGLESAILMREIVSEILLIDRNRIPIEAITDCFSLFEAAQSTTSLRDKRLRIEMAILRESLTRNEFKMKWINTKLQIADALTKADSDPRSLITQITGKHVN